MKKEFYITSYEGSTYVCSNQPFTEFEAWEALNDEQRVALEYIENDLSVAREYGYKYCAIFHMEEI